MRKHFKILTCTLLVITMVLTGMPYIPSFEDLSDFKIDFSNFDIGKIDLGSIDFGSIFDGIAQAFASSGGGPDRSDKSGLFIKKAFNYGNGDNTLLGTGEDLYNDAYLLDVNMITSKNCECSYVILKYYQNQTYKELGTVTTQILNVNAGNVYGVNLEDYMSFRRSNTAFLGSKTNFLTFLSGNKTAWDYFLSDNNTEFNKASANGAAGTWFTYTDASGTSTRFLKPFNEYAGVAYGVTGQVIDYEKYPVMSEKIYSPAFSAANDHDYILFDFEYGFYEMKSVEFVCESDNGSDSTSVTFEPYSWALYRTQPFNSSWTSISYNNDTFRLENFAFVTDSMGLSFNGEKLCEANQTNLNQKKDTSGIGAFGYVFENNKTAYHVPGIDKASGNTSVSIKDDRKVLNFAINIDDSYGAGLIDYIDPDFDHGFEECLEASIYYNDKYGRASVVTLPVITNSLLEYTMPVDEDQNNWNSTYPVLASGETFDTRETKVYDNAYSAYAQDGDTLYFSVEFPSLGTGSDGSSCPITRMDLKFSPSSDDNLIIKSIDIFDNGGENQYAHRDYYVNNSIDDITLDVNLTKGNRIYTTKTTSNGGSLNLNYSKRSYYFTTAGSEDQFNPANKYLVTIDTDGASASGTTDPVKVSFEYEDPNGDARYTMEYPLMKVIQDSYLYNQGVVTVNDYEYDDDGYIKTDEKGNSLHTTTTELSGDVNYYHYMQMNAQIQFIIDAKNVKKFTGMTVAFDMTDPTKATDNWQIKNIRIDKLSDKTVIGDRQCSPVDESITLPTVQGVTRIVNITRKYSRVISGLTAENNMINHTNQHYNLGVGQTLHIKFDDNGNGSSTEEETRDDSEYSYSMSQDKAASDLGLGEVAVEFTVKVNVAGNRDSALLDDDCGSDNLFYFQLLFASSGGTHSSSGYVLANQQLSADGFRSGYTEMFNISVNENVGDVVGINIIPDDTSADSDIYDKLCIEQIDIVRKSQNNVNKKYVVEAKSLNDGWVGQEYRDTESRESQSGRTTGEIETYMPVSYSTYELELEIAFTLSDYGAEDDQFVGAVDAEISYTSSGDTEEGRSWKSTGAIKVVEEMASYMGMSVSQPLDFAYKVSDPNEMFKAEKTYRFRTSIDDLYQLNSIKFKAYPYGEDSSVYFNVKAVEVIAITGRKINTYQDPDDGTWKCKYSDTVDIAEYNTGSSQPVGQTWTTFQFDDPVAIPTIAGNYDITSIVGRVPASANDRMNVYIYLGPHTKSPQTGSYNMYTTISYKNSKTGYTTKITPSGWSEAWVPYTGTPVDPKNQVDNVWMIYKTDIAANNMLTLASINVRAPEKLGDESLLVDYAIVQQVRAGTIIDTYKVHFGGNMFAMMKYGVTSDGSATGSQLGYEQKVSLQLTPGSMETELTPELYDIAVALRYKSLVSGDTEIYQSPYVYASDNGTTYIKSGKVLDFVFNEAYIGEIVGINIVAKNGLTAKTNGAVIETYTINSDRTRTLQKEYTICNGQTYDINATRQDLSITSNDINDHSALKRLDLTFNIMDDKDADAKDSAGTKPIKMKLSYLRHDLTCTTVTIDDIRQYVSSSDCFEPGSNTVVSMFLQGATDLAEVELEPYDDDSSNTASMNLKSIEYQLFNVTDSAKHEKLVNERLVEGSAKKLNISSNLLVLNVTYTSGGSTASDTVTNGTMNLSVDEGSKLKVSCNLGNDSYGLVIKQYLVEGEAKTLVNTQTVNTKNFEITVTNSSTTDAVNYLYEISSAQYTSLVSNLNVTVKAKDAPEADPSKVDPSDTPVNPTPENNTDDTTITFHGINGAVVAKVGSNVYTLTMPEAQALQQYVQTLQSTQKSQAEVVNLAQAWLAEQYGK